MEIDNLKKEEAGVVQQINDAQRDLRIAFLYDDYWF